MLSNRMLGTNFSRRHSEIFFLFYPEDRPGQSMPNCLLMRIVS